jgi:hypothetical protein
LGTGAENGLDDNVTAIVAGSSVVYVGGVFADAGTHSAPHIAAWVLSSNRWASLDGGVNDTVYALALNGNDLYAGGKFTQTLSPVMSVSRIARWNTISGNWAPLGYSWSNGVMTPHGINAGSFYGFAPMHAHPHADKVCTMADAHNVLRQTRLRSANPLHYLLSKCGYNPETVAVEESYHRSTTDIISWTRAFSQPLARLTTAHKWAWL